MPEVSDLVKFLEEETRAFSEMYRQEIEGGLKVGGIPVHLGQLERYDWAPSLADHFYSMLIPDEGMMNSVGLILPFRKLIFHSLVSPFLDNLTKFSEGRGYCTEYNQFAGQHSFVIEQIMQGKLPKRRNRGRAS